MSEASELIEGEDRSANLRVIGLLFGMSLVVSFYGLVVQFTLARQRGQPGGGNIGIFGYTYAATAAFLALTMLVCFILNAWLAMTAFSTIVRISTSQLSLIRQCKIPRAIVIEPSQAWLSLYRPCCMYYSVEVRPRPAMLVLCCV